MSLSFACPSCKAKIEVGDEFAGQTGQCPRCEHVFLIPTATKPPVLVAKPVGEKPTRVPPADPWAKEPPRDEEKPRPRERPRRPRPTPQPSGPLWPWLVGVLGALIVIALLFSSFLVLTLWRKTNTRNHQALIHSQPATGNQRVTAGALEGQRAVLHNGVFQVRSQLTPDDPIDPIGNICRTKAYDVELIGGRLYVLEGDGLQFDPLVRLERFGQQLGRDGAPGRRNAQLFFQPFQTDVYRVYVSSVRPANGPFTLTVRENNRPKPFVP